jgi:hypothetical protein
MEPDGVSFGVQNPTERGLSPVALDRLFQGHGMAAWDSHPK